MKHWFETEELLEFLHWWVEQHPTTTAHDLLYMLEKPWKWNTYHQEFREQWERDRAETEKRFSEQLEAGLPGWN